MYRVRHWITRGPTVRLRSPWSYKHSTRGSGVAGWGMGAKMMTEKMDLMEKTKHLTVFNHKKGIKNSEADEALS